MRPEHKDRETALKYIYHCEAQGSDDLSQDYQDFLVRFGSVMNTSFCHDLCFGTLKNLHKIDKIIEDYANNWKISRMNSVDRSLLRMGIYELLRHGTPRKVVIDEVVELAKRYGTSKSKGFINGILHNVAHNVASKKTGEVDVHRNE